MIKSPGNSKYVKNMNRMAVLNIIKQHEPISRKQLAKMTGLTPPAITGIIRELMDANFVSEEGLGTSSGGRRPMKLKFNGKAGYVIGVELTHYESIIGMADLKNDPTGIFTERIDLTQPEGLANLVQRIRRLIQEHDDKSFLGIGIAFPGLLNLPDGVVKRSINLGAKWTGVPVKKILEQEIGLPVFLENNAKAAALAERWFGGGTRYKNLVYINMGEGVSAGVIMDDCILQGGSGHAGQIGHIVIGGENGRLCNCGNRGCLEAYCGAPALERQAREVLETLSATTPLKLHWDRTRRISVEDIVNCAAQGDECCRQLLRQAGCNLGLAVANLVNMYNPDAVFIGGKTAGGGAYFLEEVCKVVRTHAFPEVASATRIYISSLGVYSGVTGACALALKELLSSPHAGILSS